MGRGDTTACQFSDTVTNLCDASSVSCRSHLLNYLNYFVFCMQASTEAAVATVLAFTQETEEVDSTSVTIAVTILSQNASALQDETVS